VLHRLKDKKADTSKHQLSQTTSICRRALPTGYQLRSNIRRGFPSSGYCPADSRC